VQTFLRCLLKILYQVHITATLGLDQFTKLSFISGTKGGLHFWLEMSLYAAWFKWAAASPISVIAEIDSKRSAFVSPFDKVIADAMGCTRCR